MADFKRAWTQTSSNEGGYVNNSKDAGRETYRGISIVHHPEWPGWPIVHKVIADLGIKDTMDVPETVNKRIDAALSVNEALAEMVDALYKNKYWDSLNLDKETDQELAAKVLDVAVNQGVDAARKGYQDAQDA